MPCRKRRSTGKPAEGAVSLDGESLTILRALAGFDKPAKCSEIAEKAGLPTRKVTGKLRGLLNRGLVSRPERGLYEITDAGRKAITT